MANFLFTSESVTEGHPDKLCDQISDAILDAIIKDDPASRVACETLVKTGFVIIAGEITTNTYVHMPEIVRQAIDDVGYTSSSMGFDFGTCAVLAAIEQQSQDIALGVDGAGVYSKEQGAGDQGMMFGFACDQTPELMPMPIMLAHRLTRRLAEARKSKELDYLRPDGKAQVTIRYENDAPVAVDTVVLSTQHTEEISHDALTEGVMEGVYLKLRFDPEGVRAIFLVRDASGRRAAKAYGPDILARLEQKGVRTTRVEIEEQQD